MNVNENNLQPTKKWMNSILPDYYDHREDIYHTEATGRVFIELRLEDGKWILRDDNGSNVEIKSRLQFKALCYGLGMIPNLEY